MIGLGANGGLQIQTQGNSLTHVYNLKAMVRVLGMAMGSEVDDADRDLMRTYCHLLEDMLPGEGEIVLEREAPPKSSPDGRTYQRDVPMESKASPNLS